MSDLDPFAGRRVSATIKYPESRKYAGDNPWLVFEGTVESVKSQIIEAFGLEGADDLPLADVVTNAQSIATANGNAMHKLGGVVVDESKWESNRKAVEEESAQSTEDKTVAHVKSLIEAAEDKDTLKDVYVRYKDHFTEGSELRTLMSERTKALKGGK